MWTHEAQPQLCGCTNMKFSTVKELTSGADNTTITVPNGYDIVINYLYLKNRATANGDVDVTWVSDGTPISFISGKSVASKEVIEFGASESAYFIMKEGDTLVVTPTNGDFVTIASFELVTATPRLNLD